MLKLYLFNATKDWDTEHAAGVIAETEEEAEKIYRLREFIEDNDYEIKEVPITKGLLIRVYGHNSVVISAAREGACADCQGEKKVEER